MTRLTIDNPLCCCGHALDEHEDTDAAPCAVCPCDEFDDNPDDEDDDR